MEPEEQRIIDQIFQGIKEEAKSIVDEAHKSAELMLEEQRKLARQKALEEASPILRKAQSETETIRGRVFTDVRKTASWMILSEKQRLVTNVLDEVKDRLRTLSQSEKYVSILEKLIVDAGAVLSGGTLEVLLNERDSTLSLKFDALAKAIDDNTGTKTQLELSDKKIETIGGVQVETFNGRIAMDNTFEGILKRNERNFRFKIVEILFS